MKYSTIPKPIAGSKLDIVITVAARVVIIKTPTYEYITVNIDVKHILFQCYSNSAIKFDENYIKY